MPTPDERPLYDFSCPACGHEMSAAKSLCMQMGINSGSGRCLRCKTYFRLKLLPDLENPTHMEAALIPAEPDEEEEKAA